MTNGKFFDRICEDYGMTPNYDILKKFLIYDDEFFDDVIFLKGDDIIELIERKSSLCTKFENFVEKYVTEERNKNGNTV